MYTFGLNSAEYIEMYLNGLLIYPVGERWYGVKFTGSSPLGTRTGNMRMHKDLPIQSKMKGCTITSEGVVKYLNPTDWSKYEDNTARNTALNTMVEIPLHYIMSIVNGTDLEVKISEDHLPGFTEIKKQYVSAYEAFNSSNTLKSIKGVIPTVSTTRAKFLEYARANGSLHWNMYTYEAHKAITWLFVVEYANRNCQASFNNALTTEGYKLGGLGEGVTAGANSGVHSFVPTGTTDSLGNNTGVVSYAASSITVSVPRYRGIENPFGHIWKNAIDVIFTNNKAYTTKDYTKFSDSLSEYEDMGLSLLSSYGYISQLIPTVSAELFATALNGSAGAYFCDYYYGNGSSTNRTLLLGGTSGDGSRAGVFDLRCHYALSVSHSGVGSRLTYLI